MPKTFYDADGNALGTFYTTEEAQPVLTAGTGITIANNVISATGGGGSSHLYNLTLYLDDPALAVSFLITDNHNFSLDTFYDLDDVNRLDFYNILNDIYTPIIYTHFKKPPFLYGFCNDINDSQFVNSASINLDKQSDTFTLGFYYKCDIASPQTGSNIITSTTSSLTYTNSSVYLCISQLL